MRLHINDKAERSWYRYYKIDLHQSRYICPSCKWFVELPYGYNCGTIMPLSGKWHGSKFGNIDAYIYYCRLWNRNELLP